MSNSRFPPKILAEVSVVIALSLILKDVLPPIIHLPQGGSITIAGLVPLLWFALRRRFYYGAFTGGIYGILHMLNGGYVINPIQGLLDYPLAFAALGLAGFFRKYPLIGVGVGIIGRFICSFLSGVFFFTDPATPLIGRATISAIYNGAYLIGEFIISSIVFYLLIKRKLIDIYL
jgi:thiamine transporter